MDGAPGSRYVTVSRRDFLAAAAAAAANELANNPAAAVSTLQLTNNIKTSTGAPITHKKRHNTASVILTEQVGLRILTLIDLV